MSDQVTFNRYGTRTYEGILPPWWDKYDVGYPDDVTETYTYSALNVDTDVQVVQAIITVVFTSPLKDKVSSVTKTFNAPGAR